MRYFLILGLVLFLAAGCSFGPKEVVLDSFEGVISAETVDYGSSEDSLVTVGADKSLKACGEQSLKVLYDLKPSGYMWIARGYGLDVVGAALWEVVPQDVKWRSYKSISVSMYGNNSGAVVAFDIKDKGGEIFRFLLEDDFSGWKEIICPFEQFFVRADWQPETAERNQVIDFPVMSFQFEPRLPGIGTYYFDCVKLVKTKK
ncbi:MAG: hypothetical protein KKH93_04300 [Candidatus Omnitrophica bacterium]|nr:hypothetical protein [Candidatus Omnitrophota bacterium]MBU2043796.1 hypothetical protein [Candidatus Omnitrophota bacterium]